jgi:hypothetical protein
MNYEFLHETENLSLNVSGHCIKAFQQSPIIKKLRIIGGIAVNASASLASTSASPSEIIPCDKSLLCQERPKLTLFQQEIHRMD